MCLTEMLSAFSLTSVSAAGKDLRLRMADGQHHWDSLAAISEGANISLVGTQRAGQLIYQS